MSFTNVDKVNGWVIRKLHSPDKAKDFGYISFKPGADGLPVEPPMEHATLTEARKAHGFVVKFDVNKITEPKSAYPQNQKGYRGNVGSPKKQQAGGKK